MAYCTKYIDRIFYDEFVELSEQKYCQRERVQAVAVSNGTVLPFVPSATNRAKGQGGVLDERGEYVGISTTPQEDLMVEGYPCEYSKVPIKQETVIYLGYFIKQWGHFLVDFLPRLWWVLDHYQNERVLILVNNPKTKIDGNYMKMLNILGVESDRVCLVHQIERYQEIIIPEMSMIRTSYYTQDCKHFFERLTEKICADVNLTPYSKIYWTRTKLKKAKMTEIGEKSIVKIFKKNGYKIMSPEKCTLEELVFYMHNCDCFASLSGTIPHNVVFAKQHAKCIILNKTFRINTIQLILNQLMGVEPIYVDSHISLLPTSPANGPFWMEVNTNFLRFAKDEHFSIPAKYLSKTRAIGMYFSGLRKAKMLKKYFLIYCRLQDQNLDIGGEIYGRARPGDEFPLKKVYFYYRRQLGYINTDTNAISFLTNLYHYWRSL